MNTDVSNYENIIIDPEEKLRRPSSAMAVLSKHDDKVDENSVVVAPSRLWKQQSWSPSEVIREEVWMKKKGQYRLKRRKAKSLTDEDLDELRGCIDLGFRFGYPEEEEDHNLCNTLPALDFYYAVNRNFNDCKFKSSPSSSSSTTTTSTQEQSADNQSSPSCEDNSSPHDQHYETWRISSPGENPQLVKTRLRHWAQLVACSIRQFS